MHTLTQSITDSVVFGYRYQLDPTTPKFLIDWFNQWMTEFLQIEEDIAEGFSFQLGFTTLKAEVVDLDGKPWLDLYAPNFKTFPADWEQNLTLALQVAAQHRFLPTRYGLSMDVPNMQDTALVGPDFQRLPMFITRSDKDVQERHSGWFVASSSAEADNTDEGQLKIMSLYELAVEAPHTIAYLALPVGSQVAFEPKATKVMYQARELTPVAAKA